MSTAEEGSSPEKQLTFNVKSSSDAKYTITVPDSLTVTQLKEKLSSSDYANVEPSRQRLIYSGRVLKDHEALSVYNIKDGNTIHLVKGAASNQQRNPASADSSVPNAGVPQNIASGTGHDPLAGLTGARYAGFAQLPGADMFGPDGGMGPDMSNPDRMLEMLENPMFQSQMNEAMNNPSVIQMMQNNPMIRNNPMLRDMLNNPEMRRMMFDPNVIRQSMQFSRMMRGAGGDAPGQGSMPAPGVTDTTPQTNNESQSTTTNPQQPQQPTPAFNPFAFQPPGGSGQQNPFASLLGGMQPPLSNPPPSSSTTDQPSSTTTTTTSPQQPRDQSQTQGQQQQPTSPPANPWASMFGGAGGVAPSTGTDPMQNMMQQMMQNPEMMRQAMQMAGLAPPGGEGGAAGGANANAFNPFSMLGGFGGMNPQTSAPPDTRPPEEIYSEQLRQLNDMGFFDFERNVRALRRSGGRVEGAIEMLLSGDV